MSSPLTSLKNRLLDINALKSATALMDWDQQTYMPHGGADARAEHTSRLSRMAHELFVADEVQRWVEDSKKEAEGDDADLVRVVGRELSLATKLPVELVAEKSKLGALGHEKWVEARRNSDFKTFAPVLERMFEIARQEAECLGYTDHIYDALLDMYEEGATAAEARAMFESVKGPQVELVKEISARPAPEDQFLYGKWEIPPQKAFTEEIVKAIGFDFNRGRQDIAPHPFCTGWSIGDIRLTTRYQDYLGAAIFGSLHEAGHGMYEQGSPAEWDLTPLAGGVSLGVHESQSRLWENIIGRSLPFWKRFLPALQARLPQLAGITPEQMFRAVNKVAPSYIRVEADELTYNLHVLVRFEIECDVLTGGLAVKDLPEAWNAKYEQYLGLKPRNDAEGCLQDVHWSMGSIGYFPTYSIGNLLSYQIWGSIQNDLGDTDALIEAGEFAPILGWLQEKVYRKGHQVPPKQLVEQVTGKPLGAEDYLNGLGSKYRSLYGL